MSRQQRVNVRLGIRRSVRPVVLARSSVISARAGLLQANTNRQSSKRNRGNRGLSPISSSGHGMQPLAQNASANDDTSRHDCWHPALPCNRPVQRNLTSPAAYAGILPFRTGPLLLLTLKYEGAGALLPPPRESTQPESPNHPDRRCDSSSQTQPINLHRMNAWSAARLASPPGCLWSQPKAPKIQP